MRSNIEAFTVKTPYASGDKPIAPRKEQAVEVSQKTDTFKRESTQKQHGKKKTEKPDTTYACWIGGGVLLAGLALLAVFQREALVATWEKLFKKSSVVTLPPNNPVKEPPKLSIEGLSEALQTKIDALPNELKPDFTVYDLTKESQLEELSLYVEGLHELKNANNNLQVVSQALSKIFNPNSIGLPLFDEAWMALAQAKRLSGHIENGKPMRLQADEQNPHIMFKYGLGSNYQYENLHSGSFLTEEMEERFQEFFHLASTELGNYYQKYNEENNPLNPYDTYIEVTEKGCVGLR